MLNRTFALTTTGQEKTREAKNPLLPACVKFFWTLYDLKLWPKSSGCLDWLEWHHFDATVRALRASAAGGLPPRALQKMLQSVVYGADVFDPYDAQWLAALVRRHLKFGKEKQQKKPSLAFDADAESLEAEEATASRFSAEAARREEVESAVARYLAFRRDSSMVLRGPDAGAALSLARDALDEATGAASGLDVPTGAHFEDRILAQEIACARGLLGTLAENLKAALRETRGGENASSAGFAESRAAEEERARGPRRWFDHLELAPAAVLRAARDAADRVAYLSSWQELGYPPGGIVNVARLGLPGFLFTCLRFTYGSACGRSPEKVFMLLTEPAQKRRAGDHEYFLDGLHVTAAVMGPGGLVENNTSGRVCWPLPVMLLSFADTAPEPPLVECPLYGAATKSSVLLRPGEYIGAAYLPSTLPVERVRELNVAVSCRPFTF
ncbi:MAG: hypothetical protein BJ554DRAFT_6289, partial [Olpidium bornovanus]